MTIKQLTEVVSGRLKPSTAVLDADILEVSKEQGNALQVKEDGLYYKESIVVDGDDALNVVSGKLTVVVSPVGDNILQKTAEGLYVQTQGNPHNTTTSDINEGTNLFFTESRVRQTVLSGLIKTNPSNVTNTDTVEIAVGKLAAKSEATTTNNWVPASTVGSAVTGFDISLFEFAKIGGMLFSRGFIKLNSSFTANTPVFTITNNDYKVVRPRVSATKNYSGLLNLQQSANTTVSLRFMITGNSTDASSAASSIQAFEPSANVSSSGEWFSVSPQNACLGKLVNP